MTHRPIPAARPERALIKALELHPKFYPRAQENLDRLRQLRAAAGGK
jgi:hypothetical protein